MRTLILIGAALAAATAATAFAHEASDETVRDYRAHVADTGAGHQGREYMSNGVVVIEGAPRWSEIRHRSVNRRFDTFFQIFD